MKTGKRIFIKTVKQIAEDFGYSQVIIHAYDGETGIQCVATYGKTLDDCDNAAKGGNAIKKLLKWDEALCHAVPRRMKNKKRITLPVVDPSKVLRRKVI